MSLYKSRRRLARTEGARTADHAADESGDRRCRLRFRCKVVLALVKGKSPTSIEEGGCVPLPRVIELPIASSTMVLKDCLIGERTTARTRSRSFKSWDCCPS